MSGDCPCIDTHRHYLSSLFLADNGHIDLGLGAGQVSACVLSKLLHLVDDGLLFHDVQIQVAKHLAELHDISLNDGQILATALYIPHHALRILQAVRLACLVRLGAATGGVSKVYLGSKDLLLRVLQHLLDLLVGGHGID